MQRLDLKFGAVPRHDAHVTDVTERLPEKELEKLRARVALFERKFPQTFLSVFIIGLPEGVEVGEYAFWLANRALFSALETVGEENFDILLVVNTTAGAAALTVGYGLEPFVTEDDLEAALEAGRASWMGGDIAAGIRACVDKLQERLRRIALTAPGPKQEAARELIGSAPYQY